MLSKTITALCASLLITTGCVSQAESKPKVASEQAIIYQSAAAYCVPKGVIQYVGKKESGMRCRPGNPRYHGPLQISLGSARALGYKAAEGPLNSCGAGLK